MEASSSISDMNSVGWKATIDSIRREDPWINQLVVILEKISACYNSFFDIVSVT